MIVVRHKTVVMKYYAVTFHIEAHQLFKVFIVLFVTKDIHPIDTSVDDVIKADYLNAWFSWHRFSFWEYSI